MFFPEPGGRPVISPSDLRAASTCELALLTEMDVRLGRTPRGEVVEDPMLQRAAQLGEEHEQRVLAALEAAHPGRVHRVEVRERSLAGWADAHADTVAALSSDAEVIYQAVLLGDRFLGLADFLVRDEAGRWLVCDTKLARRESVPALLQVAAYADVLAATGAEVAPVARLILGDGDERDVALADVVPVMRARLARLRHVLDTHQDEGVRSPGATAAGSRACAARPARSTSRRATTCCSSRACTPASGSTSSTPGSRPWPTSRPARSRSTV